MRLRTLDLGWRYVAHAFSLPLELDQPSSSISGLLRALVLVFLALPLAAQEPASPAPVAEKWLFGNIEFGERWVGGISGDLNTYRSVVDLGEGPKLFGLDLTVQNSSRKLFDKLTVRGNSWGGDPYNTSRVELQREGAYNLSVDYRNLAYFNALPSFADPTLERGFFLNQRSFDIHRRMFDVELELLPGRRIVPYVAYSRDWGSGSGITDFVSDSNEYAVRNDLRDRTNHFRGGVRFELRRFHLTLEQGGTTFKDHQRVFHSGTHPGNRTTPILGQQLFLDALEQQYRVEGDSIYSKGLVTANPASWVNLYGQFLYSQPSSDTDYAQDNSGQFILLRTRQFFTTQQVLLTSEAKQPHTSGSFGAELRLHPRLRVIESWMTDRFRTSAAVLREQIATSSPEMSTVGARLGSLNVERLELNYNRQELNVLFDPASWLTLRGGHRYVWGDAKVRAPALSQSGPQESGELKMHVGLAGLVFRPAQKLSVNFDFEGASADRNYFRTSLQDYQRVRVRARYQALGSLSLSANFSLLSNENPAPNIRYDFLSRENSLSVFWTPWGGKRVSVIGDYSRATLRSDLNFLDPLTLQREGSFYRDNAHIGTGILEVNLPAVNQVSPKLSVGGSLFISSGSRPTEHYQPLGRFLFPVHRKVHWFFEWRWYSLSERFYLFEGFRTHHYVTGLRLAL